MTQALTYNEKVNGIRKVLSARRDKIALLLPKHLDVDRLLRVVILSIERTPKLLDCSPASVLRSVMEAAQLGLMVGPPINHAHLVPYAGACQLIPDYRGLVHLAVQGGLDRPPDCDVVCDGDEWAYWRDEKGTHYTHRPAWKRGAVLGAYCAAYIEGELLMEVMTLEQLEHVRAKSKMGQSGAWVSDTAEMYRKTVIKRAAKRWSLSPEKAERFFKAVAKDNAIETGEPEDVLGDLDVIDVEATAEEPEEPKSKADRMADRLAATVDPNTDPEGTRALRAARAGAKEGGGARQDSQRATPEAPAAKRESDPVVEGAAATTAPQPTKSPEPPASPLDGAPPPGLFDGKPTPGPAPRKAPAPPEGSPEERFAALVGRVASKRGLSERAKGSIMQQIGRAFDELGIEAAEGLEPSDEPTPDPPRPRRG